MICFFFKKKFNFFFKLDINNTSIPLLFSSALSKYFIFLIIGVCKKKTIKPTVESEYYPMLSQVIDELRQLGMQWRDVAMLARTHGQPATPTRMGKEFLVYVERLQRQCRLLKLVPHSAKFGGAVGE